MIQSIDQSKIKREKVQWNSTFLLIFFDNNWLWLLNVLQQFANMFLGNKNSKHSSQFPELIFYNLKFGVQKFDAYKIWINAPQHQQLRYGLFFRAKHKIKILWAALNQIVFISIVPSTICFRLFSFFSSLLCSSWSSFKILLSDFEREKCQHAHVWYQPAQPRNVQNVRDGFQFWDHRTSLITLFTVIDCNILMQTFAFAFAFLPRPDVYPYENAIAQGNRLNCMHIFLSNLKQLFVWRNVVILFSSALHLLLHWDGSIVLIFIMQALWLPLH